MKMALGSLVITILIVVLGYKYYAQRVDRDIIQADPKRATPATMYNDGVDFMPASGSVLFGYQFKSIAALGPIVGPITAIQYGWLPSILWLVIGVFFIGWVQDYASAMLAMRNDGMTMGGLSYKFISPRARSLLLSFMYIYLLLIMGAFGALIAPLLANPIVPIGFFILVLAGILAGQMTYRWKMDLLLTTVVTVLIALIGIWLGTTQGSQNIINAINGLAGDPETGVLFHRPLGYGDMTWANFFWGIVMLAFCYLGSVLPIWRFAQPVNYTSFWFVFLGIIGSLLGIVVATFTGAVNTAFDIPAFVTAFQPHLGPIWPLLFVTISCGAISGWHSLVSTSGTARQLEKETDALPVGGGAMYTEAVLGVLSVVFAATIGVAAGKYDPAQGYKLVAGAAGVFAVGMSKFMSVLGVPESLGGAIGMVFLVVMALTVMQLVLRFMRVASAELLGDKIPAFKNPHVGSLVAVLLTLFLITFGFWQWIWALFGGSNQLFAGMSLLLISIWLARDNKPSNWSFWPGMFMYITTVAALLYVSVYNAIWKGIINAGPDAGAGFIIGNLITAAFGLYMVVAAIILFVDGLKAYNQARGGVAAAPAGD
ncbi:MAG: carbon starvation protein A [Anaerolineae bacterium]|nr:MAG: carbon starvation protein A [Anaerolineae bacterium]